MTDDLETRVREWLRTEAPSSTPDSVLAKLSTTKLEARPRWALAARRRAATVAFASILAFALVLAGAVAFLRPFNGPSAPGSDQPPAGGVSREQAVAAARANYPDATGVVGATVGRVRDFAATVNPGDRWVWAVVVSGSFPFSCGPALPSGESGATHGPCPAPATTRTVLVDYLTGGFVVGFSGQADTSTPDTTGVVPLASGEFTLPTLPVPSLPPGAARACAGIGLVDAVLRGGANDPKTVWLVSGGSKRFELVWPPGYRARFNPTLEVLDPVGNVVARDGEQVNGACVTADQNVLSMEPPFEFGPPPTVP